VRISLARDEYRCADDHEGHAGLDVGLPLADGADMAFLDGDVGLDDTPVIDDQRIGDDGIGPRLACW